MASNRTPFMAYSQLKKRRLNRVRNIFIKTLVENDFLDNIPEPYLNKNINDRAPIPKELWIKINKDNIRKDYGKK
jgi:hypothetical protein